MSAKVERAKTIIAEAFGLLNQLPHGDGPGTPATDALIEAQQALATARRAIDRWEAIADEDEIMDRIVDAGIAALNLPDPDDDLRQEIAFYHEHGQAHPTEKDAR